MKNSHNSDLSPFIIDEADFIWQMDLLSELGYEPITTRDILNPNYTNKKILITFDDCAGNLIDHAIPHLEKKKWKAVFFAPFSHLGGYNEWNVRKGKTKINLMTHEEVKFLSDSGHEIGAHSMTHPHLNDCSQKDAANEIIESKKQLEILLKKPVHSFAYPYGHYPENYKAIMTQAGYTWGFAMESDAPTILSDPFCIKRVVIEQGETKISFLKKLTSFQN